MNRDRHGRMPGKVRRWPAIEDRQLHSREQRNGPIARHRVGLPPNPTDRAMADPANFASGGNRCAMYFELAIPNGRGMVGHAKGLAAWPIGSATEGWRSGRLRPSEERLISL